MKKIRNIVILVVIGLMIGLTSCKKKECDYEAFHREWYPIVNTMVSNPEHYGYKTPEEIIGLCETYINKALKKYPECKECVEEELRYMKRMYQ